MSRGQRRIAETSILILFGCLSTTPVRADGEGESVYKRLLRSTVWVIVPQTREPIRPQPGSRRSIPIATGSGSLIDVGKKLVLTNYHVVGDKDEAFVFFPRLQKADPIVDRQSYYEMLSKGQAIQARVKMRDAKRDLALLELASVPAGAQSLPLAKDSASPGQRVHSIGNPGASGALWVYTSGTVRTAAYHKTYRSGSRDQPMQVDAFVIETQSPTNPGDSGGPLVNDFGELVAVTQGGISDAQQLSLFIDVREVAGLLTTAKIKPQYAVRRGKDGKEKLPEDDGEKTASTLPAKKKPEESPTDKAEKQASTKLKYARLFLADKKPQYTKEYCEQILKDFPQTKAAVEAKKMLEDLNKN